MVIYRAGWLEVRFVVVELRGRHGGLILGAYYLSICRSILIHAQYTAVYPVDRSVYYK